MSEHTETNGHGTVFCAHCGDILFEDSEPHGDYCKRAKAIAIAWVTAKIERCGYADCSSPCGYCLDDLCSTIRAALIEADPSL